MNQKEDNLIDINQDENKNPKKNNCRHWLLRHPLFTTVLTSVLLGAILSLGFGLWGARGSLLSILQTNWEDLLAIGLIGGIMGITMILPILLTIAEAVFLFQPSQWQKRLKRFRVWDLLVLSLGCFYSFLYTDFVYNIMWDSNWTEMLHNGQMHTPIYTQSMLTVLILALVGLAGYLVVNFIPLDRMPPLLLVLGMAAMYLGMLESIIWGVQICLWRDSFDFLLTLLPLNCVLITARTVLNKVQEWKIKARPGTKVFQNPFLNSCNRILEKAELWPLLALLLMWPLLGILIGILVLLGQEPDAVIKAWTETSGWRLSQRVAPQNIYYDEHYLCTVAAGGHRKIVKPVRLGVRHGHEVIVNRQLCIANAFEQVLEERTPRFHRVVRRFYDACGFPIARLIRFKGVADIIYIVMKPLEWFFLVVLYLTDANPENRIAVQYTGKKPKDFA